jgi:hypothetical protein
VYTYIADTATYDRKPDDPLIALAYRQGDPSPQKDRLHTGDDTVRELSNIDFVFMYLVSRGPRGAIVGCLLPSPEPADSLSDDVDPQPWFTLNLSELARRTGYARTNLSRAAGDLVRDGIVLRQGDEYQLNMDPSTWLKPSPLKLRETVSPET